jgi:hypothetical protein
MGLASGLRIQLLLSLLSLGLSLLAYTARVRFGRRVHEVVERTGKEARVDG